MLSFGTGRPAVAVLAMYIAYGGQLACLGQTSAVINPSLESNAATTSTGRKATATGGPIALPDDFSNLRIDPYDSISFDVFGVPEMGALLSVDGNGEVDVPLVGHVHVAGETVQEAAERIGRTLVDRQLLNAPQVSLKIVEYAKQAVSVAGEVQAPGKVNLLAPRSLLDVLTLVGGETTAAGGDIEVDHRLPDGSMEVTHVPYIANKDPAAIRAATVYPGDSVYVRRAGVVYVLGAVGRPGGYVMVNGGVLTLTQAIAYAQGTTLVASNKQLLIVRKQNGQITRLTTSLKEQETGKLAEVRLVDGDMIYVPTSKIKAALVNSQYILQAAASSAVTYAFYR